MRESDLPRPEVTWDSVYELLRCLAEATDDPHRRGFQSVALISGMQAGDPIEEWLLRELLALGGLDLEEPAALDATASALATLEGAGLIEVLWEPGSRLRRVVTEECDVDFGRRYRELYRAKVLSQMHHVEVGLRLALEARDGGEDTDREDDPGA